MLVAVAFDGRPTSGIGSSPGSNWCGNLPDYARGQWWNLAAGRHREAEYRVARLASETLRAVRGGASWTCSPADAVSLLRPVAAVAVLILFQFQPLALALMLTAVLLMDALDGWLARRFGSSRWGAFIDLIGDRGVELAVLFFYAAWGWISPLIPLLFLIRGFMTDTIRLLNDRYPDPAYRHPLSIGGADSRFSRALTNSAKIAVCLVAPFDHMLGNVLAWLAALINLYRGVPVIVSPRARQLLKAWLRAERP